MNELVFLQKDEVFTTSILVADNFHKRHDRVLRAIENLIIDLPKNGVVKFIKSDYKDAKGELRKMYLLNRDAFSLLVMGFTGKAALDWKLKYIEAFNSMEAVIREKSTTIWLETRKQGKLTRKDETDGIKKFIEYAIEQGSNHSSWYYKAFSELADKMCGIKPKHRDDATVVQLNNLAIFENIILEVIKEGLKEKLPYKQIYQNCKSRCEQAKEVAMIS